MAWFPLRLIPQSTSIDFIGKKYVAFALSGLAMLASVLLLIFNGLNFGIDFTGGTIVEARFSSPPELATLRTLLDHERIGELHLQEFGDTHDVMIRLQGASTFKQTAPELVSFVKETLNTYDQQIEYRKIDMVGPQVGAELIRSGVIATVVAFMAMLLYIWVRFKWHFGVGAVSALAHDAIITLGFFSLTQLEFNLTSIAAMLMIVGYSINDTVVIYDRIRENLRLHRKQSLKNLINQSINETLSRTVLTVVTTMLAVIALVFLGGEVLRSFSLSVLFGITIGTYSSMYIATALLDSQLKGVTISFDEDSEKAAV